LDDARLNFELFVYLCERQKKKQKKKLKKKREKTTKEE